MLEMTTGDIQTIDVQTNQEEPQGQGTRVIQVTNVAKTATFDQLKIFFELLGEIEELKVFPSQDLTSYGSKVCYVKYQDESSVHVAQHLTNTVFIDRALIVVPLGDGIIPEERLALLMVTPATAVAGNYASRLLLPITQGVPGIIQTVIGSVMPIVRMQLTVPQLPALSDVDPVKLDEIRRTVHIRHLPKDITAEQLMSFFSACGDIQYVRIAGDEEEATGYAFIEFNEAICVSRALQYNGALFGGVPLKVGYSKHAIVKPEKEITRTKSVMDKTMRKVTEATKLVSEELDDDDKAKSRKTSRSPSQSRGKRSRSRSPSKSTKRSSSISRDRNYRTRRRSPSRERFRGGARPRMSKSRSRSPSPSRRMSQTSGSRTLRRRRSTSRNRKSRTPSPNRDRKRRRSSSRGRSKDTLRRRSRDRSRDRGKDKPKDSSRKKSERKDAPKSPEKKKKDEDEKRSEKEEVDEEKKEEGKEISKKKSEKTRSQSRSRSRSRQREKKKEKSASRSASRSPKHSSSKHKKRKEKRDKTSSKRASDDEYEGKKQGKGSEDEERQKPNRMDGSDDDRKKVDRRRRSDDDGAGSEPDDNKKKKRHYKKKPISADHYDSESN